MERILTDSLNEYLIPRLDVHTEENINDMLYLNKEQNWNIDACFKGKFNEHFISQAIHDLYDHTNWSFYDILRINYLWTDLKIIQQNFETI